ncbi:SMRP1 protein, partial [Herpetotheres cachinnans]|nr:SMRP1 protein [Herpetotheres cachinnans]
MYVFSKKHKTAVSAYTDSYCSPCSVKKTIQEQAPQQLWREIKFVTKGLTMPLVQNPASQGQPKQLIKVATQEHCRNTIDLRITGWPAPQDTPACLFCIAEKYNSVFVKEDKYITWRTSPYNSAAWNKHSFYLPLLPKVDASPPGPPKLELPQTEVVTDMPYRLPMCTVMGRGPFQGYYSPCSGHHNCLRGINYSIDGTPAIRRHLHTVGERAVKSIRCCSYSPRAMFWTSTHHAQPSSLYQSPRWDTSHFKKTGGVQRGSYTIHPEFISEAYPACPM